MRREGGWRMMLLLMLLPVENGCFRSGKERKAERRSQAAGRHRAMERDVVRVRAVVMTRDDSTGGWVPLGRGGLSHVVICRGQSPESRGHRSYVVRGERLRDRAPVLDCAVQKGLVYNKVNPIFHHWRVEDRKFGLTFQSPADAISFEKGLRSVIDRLERGSESPFSSTPEEGDAEDDAQSSQTDSESTSNSRKERQPKPITIVTSKSSSTSFMCPPVAEDFGYGVKPAISRQTPAMSHIRPVQHQASSLTTAASSPATLPAASPPLTPTAPPAASTPLSTLSSPLSLLEQGDLKELWGSRGYEDYRRAEIARTVGGGFQGGSVLQDKSEMCVVHFEKEMTGMGVGGVEVGVNLDSKVSQRLSSGSATCVSAPNTGTGIATTPGSPLDAEKGSPSPCCIHTSLSTPRSRSWRRGGKSSMSNCGLSLGLVGLSLGEGTICPADSSPCHAASSSPSSRCVYCRSIFSASENARGRCQDAPDPVLRCLRQWTCVWCAESLLYHCTSDPEGEFWEPCSCEEMPGERPHVLCCARWAALLVLSLFVPCMCCYLPLCICLRCGERCGCCGGKHKAAR
ncbi:sprouty-related, EVH1 domain-containing protein 3 [Arapaima gigas]